MCDIHVCVHLSCVFIEYVLFNIVCIIRIDRIERIELDVRDTVTLDSGTPM